MPNVERSLPQPGAPRPEVPGVLHELRRRIRRYVVLEGSALVLAVVGSAFWVSLAVDYWLEPAAGARRALLLLAAAAMVAMFVWNLGLRLARSFRARALALVLERRFPQLNDRLITAVELAESRTPPTGLTAAMLARAADEASELSRKLELREVFNLRPLARAIGLAALLLVSVAGFRLAQAEVFTTWFRRSVLLSDELYRRDTDLRVVVLAEPGERVVEFRDGVYKHPRGGDLTIRAEVPEGRKIPDRVQYSFRNVAARGGGGDYMTKIGQRQFRLKLAGLYQSIDLSLRAGDFSTRNALKIQVVEAPQIGRLALLARYPEYTGLNNPEEVTQPAARQAVPVLGAQVSLPAGTDFLMQASFNKPLHSLRVQTDRFEIACQRGEPAGVLTVPASVGQPAREYPFAASQPLLASDGASLTLPAMLATAPSPELVAEGKVHVPLRLEPDAVLRITLHDEDDVVSPEPIRLAVNSIPDDPPHVETRLKGIGNSITRQATIPLIGEAHDPQDASQVYGVTDDYGIADVHFEYRLEAAKPDVESKFVPVPFVNHPEGARQFAVDEKFKVLPLDLAIGQRLVLKVVAVDGDDQTGPHVSSGTPYHFQIVSDDALLALVAVKELNIRRRFEQILEEVRNTRKDLLLGRTRLDEARAQRTEPNAEIASKLADLDVAVFTTVERSINAVRKNANETQSIEQEFGDIRDELENNAVPDVKPMLERINGGIISPLHSINTLDYNLIDDSIVLLRRALEEKADPFARFDESVDQLSLTIEHLEAVLAQMLKLETVNEALQMLRDIIKAQEELQEKTRQERKKKLIEGLQ
ncbi:MAG: hypothetical protein HY290_32525 [Planctomycetia bacterium]|nr:hypothetical protein [Planctomycetia bacterium]